MGVHSIANACAHLQNATRARLGLTSLPNTKYNLRLVLAMHRAALLASESEVVNFENVASRRLWIGLKYWNNEPVMRDVMAVSKPSRLVTAKLDELNKVARGLVWAS
ncbi:hypothetical protein N0V88_004225 [Collariella sp. IMI 366227]|nr:hypothetical protein N0V88_004225 [Collariella sp. IMI 366227]